LRNALVEPFTRGLPASVAAASLGASHRWLRCHGADDERQRSGRELRSQGTSASPAIK